MLIDVNTLVEKPYLTYYYKKKKKKKKEIKWNGPTKIFINNL